MFAPYCPVHQSRVLLFEDNIERLIRTSAGIQIVFVCNCGYHGTWCPGPIREAA
jgi:hypothetical protein